MKKQLTLLGLSLMATAIVGNAQLTTGPSSSRSPYVVPATGTTGVKVTSIMTVGDSTSTGYKMAGIGDGMGAFDNGNGTFTLLLNHEIGATNGSVRAHGTVGAFVSKWVINKSNLAVVSGGDLIQNTWVWNDTFQSFQLFNDSIIGLYNLPRNVGFGRFCSADLPAVSAFYNANSGKGTQERIFMNGEEVGSEGRAWGHIVTGPFAGHSYQLPRLGKFSWENSVANPATGDKTVVVGLDDATPGQVYVYIGDKQNTGNDIEKAGLTNGSLYGVAVSNLLLEANSTVAPGANYTNTFSLVNLGNQAAFNGVTLTGAALNTASNNAGVTNFLRPEDGAWDPRHPEDFYFVTTNSFTSPSRLWKLHFSNINDLTQGGTITCLLDGSEGQKMMDNIGFDNYGNLFIQEDPGNQTYLAKNYSYNVDTDVLTTILTSDPARFTQGMPGFLTIDEESSGVIDMESILGPGWMVGVMQAHYTLPNPLVEGGQLYAFLNPASECAGLKKAVTVVGPTTFCAGRSVSLTASPATSFMWSNGAMSRSIAANASGNYSCVLTGSNGCTVNSDTVAVTVNGTKAQITPAGSTSICPGASVQLNANTAAGTIYRWTRDGVNAGSGASATSINANKAGNYRLVTLKGGCSDTAFQTVTLNTPPSAAIATPAATTFCPGTSVALSAANSGSGFSYAWTRNNAPVGTGATVQAGTGGAYRVVVTETATGCSATSAPVYMTALTPTTATIAAVGGTSLPIGGSRLLRSNNSSMFTFQWFLNNAPISGATLKNYSATTAGAYYVVVTRISSGCVDTSSTLMIGANQQTRETEGASQVLASNTEVSVTAYPNPVSNNLTVVVDGLETVNGNIQVLDLNGRVVAQQSATASATSIDMSNVANGLYIVRFTDINGNQAVLKVSKQ